MNQLSKETENSLLTIVDTFLLETNTNATEISLFNILNRNSSISKEMFSQNIEEYLFLSIAQRLLSSYTIGLGKVVIQLSEELIKSQGGEVIESQRHSDLTFRLKDGSEHQIEIKSIQDLGCNRSMNSKGHMIKQFIYDNEQPILDENVIDEIDFWALVGGSPNTKSIIYKMLNGTANHFSMSSLLKNTHARLLSEWRMPD